MPEPEFYIPPLPDKDLSDLQETLRSLVAEGCHTILRLISLAKGNLLVEWSDMSDRDVDRLATWLGRQVDNNRGPDRIRWTIIRDVLNTVREQQADP